jgi:hypothetical protein
MVEIGLEQSLAFLNELLVLVAKEFLGRKPLSSRFLVQVLQLGVPCPELVGFGDGSPKYLKRLDKLNLILNSLPNKMPSKPERVLRKEPPGS